MKKFVEKLISELKAGRNKECANNVPYIRLCDAISIVNELAEEYNNGWIPCSERLPDKEGTYLVTLKKWGTITFARFTDIKTNPHFNALVIAWMPLPEPYKG